MSRLGVSLLLCLCLVYLHAQDRCAVKPKPQAQIEAFEKWLDKKQSKRIQRTEGPVEEVYTIPVVFHIVHQGEPIGTGTNLPEERILEQIDILNEDFRRLNDDALNTPSDFLPVAADIRVEFVLARQDPDGFPTNGIVRVKGSQASYTFVQDHILKEESYWPSENYLNIWVAEANFLGWATFPQSDLPGLDGEDDPTQDGVVIDTDYVGVNLATGGSFDSYGRTGTHEVGHFLGLRHVWGDGNCLQDDFCEDTPPSSEDHGGLGSPCNYPGPDTCPLGDPDLPDMFMNFMDYTDDECMNLFTQDQKFRMRTVLDNSPRRASLLTSPGLELPVGALNRDLSLKEVIDIPTVTCDESLTATLNVVNHGSDEIHSLKLEYRVGTQVSELELAELSIPSGGTFAVPLALSGYSLGRTSLDIAVLEVNNNTDENDLNDELSATVVYDNSQLSSPFREKFEEDPWLTVDPANGAAGEWIQNDDMAFVEAFNSFSRQTSWLVSPTFSLENYQEAGLFFDLSYALSGDVDILEVRVATECSGEFQTVWNKNLDDLDFRFVLTAWNPDSDDDWVEEFVDLTPFAGNSNVRLAFVFENKGGNNLFLDNIELTNNANPEQPRLDPGNFVVYPNPATGSFHLTINLPVQEDVRVQIISVSGEVVADRQIDGLLNQTLTFDLGNETGVYFVRVSGRDIQQVERILLSR